MDCIELTDVVLRIFLVLHLNRGRKHFAGSSNNMDEISPCNETCGLQAS